MLEHSLAWVYENEHGVVCRKGVYLRHGSLAFWVILLDIEFLIYREHSECFLGLGPGRMLNQKYL